MKPKQKKQPTPWFRIEAAADGGDVATVWLYDEIVEDDYWFDDYVVAKRFVQELADITAGTIHLRVNCPGGSVFAAMTIYTALRNHPARVVAFIDGLAASAASFVILAAAEVRMTKGAFLMIHNSRGITFGDRTDHRDNADRLEKVDGQILAIYQAKTGTDEATLREQMDAETWFTADEAKVAGFVDVIEHAEAVKAVFDLSVYARVPDALRDAPTPPQPRQIKTERDLEACLRDECGLSHAAAKKIVAGGFKALDGGPRDEDDAGAPPTPPADGGADVMSALNAAILNARITLMRTPAQVP